MRKSATFFIKIMLVGILYSVSQAEYVPLSQAPLSIVKQDSTFHIKKDGAIAYELEEHLKVNNDQGRVLGATKQIQYLRHLDKLKIDWAKTVFNNRAFEVHRDQIIDRSAASPKEGVTDIREKIISFNNIYVGSEIQYKYSMTEKKPMIPGLFGMTFEYGLEEPEMNETTKVISEKPIYFRVSDPKKYLDVKANQEDGHYVLTVVLKKPIFHLPSKDEILPVIDPTTVPMVFVSINKNWSEVSSMFSERFEKVLSQPLPKEYQAILKKAENEKNEIDRINMVTSELAQQMTYAGDWKRIDDLFFPKDLQKISSLKTGDCKDFATATSAILRKLGMQASVALVQRADPSSPGILMMRQNFPIEEPMVNMQTWNHAMVKVTLKDGQLLWLDPTNPVSNAGYVKSDIVGSPALVLNSSSQRLETVQSLFADSVLSIHKKIKIRGDNTAEVTGTVETKGITDVEFLEMAWQKGAESLQKIYGLLMSFGEKSFSENIQDIPGKSRISKPTTVHISAAIPSPIKEVSENVAGKKTLRLMFQMGLPSQLKIFSLVTEKRTSHMAIGEASVSEIENEVEGYHVKDPLEAECYMVSPWIDMQRTAGDTPTGFVVRYQFHQKKTLLLKKEIKSLDFELFMGDLQRCAEGQQFEVELIPPVKAGAPVIAQAPPDLNKAYELAKKTDNHKSLIEARRILMQALAKDPKNAKAHAALSNAILGMGYFSGYDYGSAYLEAAAVEAELALQSDATLAEPHVAKAQILITRNQIDAAKVELSQSYKIDPKNTKFFYLAARISEKEKKFDLAEKYLLAELPLLKTVDQKIGLYNSLGSMRRSAKAYPEAIQYFKKGLELDPKDDWLLGNTMAVYMDMKKWDEAIEFGKKALEVDDHNIYRGSLATAYARKGTDMLSGGNLKPEQELEVEKLFQSALKLKNDQPNAILGMGVLYFQMGKRLKDRILLAQAKEYLERAFSKNPMDPYIIHALIGAKEALGMKAEVRLPASMIKGSSGNEQKN